MPHTPGDWSYHTNGIDYSITAKDFHGATCYLARLDRFRNESGEFDDESNAKLIAAAPKMLEALQFFVDQWDNYDDGDIGEAYVKASSAIAKATAALGELPCSTGQ